MSVISDGGEISSNHVLPIHNINFLSIMTFHWISGFMWRVYRKGYATLDMMWTCCKEESTKVNGLRQDLKFLPIFSTEALLVLFEIL